MMSADEIEDAIRSIVEVKEKKAAYANRFDGLDAIHSSEGTDDNEGCWAALSKCYELVRPADTPTGGRNEMGKLLSEFCHRCNEPAEYAEVALDYLDRFLLKRIPIKQYNMKEVILYAVVCFGLAVKLHSPGSGCPHRQAKRSGRHGTTRSSKRLASILHRMPAACSVQVNKTPGSLDAFRERNKDHRLNCKAVQHEPHAEASSEQEGKDRLNRVNGQLSSSPEAPFFLFNRNSFVTQVALVEHMFDAAQLAAAESELAEALDYFLHPSTAGATAEFVLELLLPSNLFSNTWPAHHPMAHRGTIAEITGIQIALSLSAAQLARTRPSVLAVASILNAFSMVRQKILIENPKQRSEQFDFIMRHLVNKIGAVSNDLPNSNAVDYARAVLFSQLRSSVSAGSFDYSAQSRNNGQATQIDKQVAPQDGNCTADGENLPNQLRQVSDDDVSDFGTLDSSRREPLDRSAASAASPSSLSMACALTKLASPSKRRRRRRSSVGLTGMAATESRALCVLKAPKTSTTKWARFQTIPLHLNTTGKAA